MASQHNAAARHRLVARQRPVHVEILAGHHLAKTTEPPVARSRISRFFVAAMVSTLTARSTSVTLIVPMAEDRRPAKGKQSGPREHCTLTFTRLVERAQTSNNSTSSFVGLAAASSEVKMADCCPKCIFSR